MNKYFIGTTQSSLKGSSRDLDKVASLLKWSNVKWDKTRDDNVTKAALFDYLDAQQYLSVDVLFVYISSHGGIGKPDESGGDGGGYESDGYDENMLLDVVINDDELRDRIVRLRHIGRIILWTDMCYFGSIFDHVSIPNLVHISSSDDSSPALFSDKRGSIMTHILTQLIPNNPRLSLSLVIDEYVNNYKSFRLPAAQPATLQFGTDQLSRLTFRQLLVVKNKSPERTSSSNASSNTSSNASSNSSEPMSLLDRMKSCNCDGVERVERVERLRFDDSAELEKLNNFELRLRRTAPATHESNTSLSKKLEDRIASHKLQTQKIESPNRTQKIESPNRTDVIRIDHKPSGSDSVPDVVTFCSTSFEKGIYRDMCVRDVGAGMRHTPDVDMVAILDRVSSSLSDWINETKPNLLLSLYYYLTLTPIPRPAIYYYHKEGCPACRLFDEYWEKFVAVVGTSFDCEKVDIASISTGYKPPQVPVIRGVGDDRQQLFTVGDVLWYIR